MLIAADNAEQHVFKHWGLVWMMGTGIFSSCILSVKDQIICLEQTSVWGVLLEQGSAGFESSFQIDSPKSI